MKIENLDVSDVSKALTCHTLLITEIDSFERLMQVYDEQAAEHPAELMLISLDDLQQAKYTSMHATSTHELDDVAGYDLTNVHPNAFEDGEHLGYPSTVSEFFILEENFRKKCGAADFAEACAKGLTLDDDELDTLEQINANPALMLDSKVILRRVPVRESSMLLSAFPNGYFTCDLDPFENYALAEHLRQHYGYDLFGLGASCIGFRRAEPLDAAPANALGRDIARLYNCDDDPDKVARIAQIARNGRYLLLKYVDYIEID